MPKTSDHNKYTAVASRAPDNRAFFHPAIQTKLTVNEQGDRYEQEADSMADRVMRMSGTSAQPAFATPAISQLQRKCAPVPALATNAEPIPAGF